MKNSKRYLRLVSFIILLVTLLTFGWSYFTDYQVRQLKTEGGVSLEVSGDAGTYNTSQTGYKVIKNGKGWYKKGTEATVNTVVKTGYTFDGWYDGGTRLSNTTSYKFPINEATVLQAKTNINRYTITAELDGGMIDGKTTWSTEYDITKSVKLPTPTKKGYTFLGWVEKGSTSAPEMNYTIPAGSTGNKVFVAKWSINQYYLDVNAYLDGQFMARGLPVRFDVYINGVLEAKDARDFCRLFDYGTTYEVKNIRPDEGITYLGLKSSLPLKGVISNTAIDNVNFNLKTNEYTFRFKYLDSTQSMPDFKVKHGEKKNLPVSTFTRDYYTQVSWNTLQNGGGTQYALGADTSKYSGKDGDIITLYPQYRENVLTLSYYANGGTGVSWQKKDFLDTYKLNAFSTELKDHGLNSYDGNGGKYADLKKLGYHGIHYWHVDNATSSVLVDDTKLYPFVSDMVSDAGKDAEFRKGDVSINLYASWKENILTVSYFSNGATEAFGSTAGLDANTSFFLKGVSYKATQRQPDGLLNYKTDVPNQRIWKDYHTGSGLYFTGKFQWTIGNTEKYIFVSQDKGFSSGMEMAKALGVNIDYSDAKVIVAPYWEDNKMTIRYHGNGGTGVAEPVSEEYSARLLDFRLPRYDNNGYTSGKLYNLRRLGHVGTETWKINNTDISCGTSQSIEDLSKVLGVSEQFKKGNVTVDAYAQWREAVLTVKIHSNHATSLNWKGAPTNYVPDTDIVVYTQTFKGERMYEGGLVGYSEAGSTIEMRKDYHKGTGIYATAYGNTVSEKLGFMAVDLAKALGTSIDHKDATVDVYPQWRKNTLAIKYNANGGKVSGNGYTTDSSGMILKNGNSKFHVVNFDERMETGLYNWDSTFNISKSGGSAVVGSEWCTEPNGVGTAYNQETKYYPKDMIDLSKGDRELILYVNWTDSDYVIRYELNNGGTAGLPSIHCKYNQDVTIFQCDGSRDYYTFVEWNTQKDGKGTVYKAGQKVRNLTDKHKGEITLYAQWRVNELTIRYNSAGGTLTSKAGKGFSLDTYRYVLLNGNKDFHKSSHGLPLLPNQPSNGFYDVQLEGNIYLDKYGYIPKKGAEWIDDRSKTYDDKATYKADDVANLISKDVILTVYPNWIPKVLNITLHRNFSSTDTVTAKESFSFDGTASQRTIKTSYKRDGYTFKGWSTNPNATTAEVSSVVDTDFIDSKYPNVSLYAIWVKDSYSISYDLQGGTVSGNPTQYSIDTATFTLKNPTKKGYKFLGWTGSNGTVPQTTVTIQKGSVGNKTYKANWKLDRYVLDVDNYIDDTHEIHGTAITFDMYINGSLYKSNITDFYEEVDSGTKFELRNIRLASGYRQVGFFSNTALDVDWVQGFSGTVGDKYTVVCPMYYKTHTNYILHWLFGFKNMEGNNGTKDARLLQSSTFSKEYGSSFILDSNALSRVPNGCYRWNTFGTRSISGGTWNRYPFSTSVVQKSEEMSFEYTYSPYDYNITYNLDGGTNNSSNPKTYNVLYGVTLKNPVKDGYTFEGWYNSSGTKVTGINEGANATFTSSDDLYAKLAKRTTGDITLTAKWRPNATISVSQSGTNMFIYFSAYVNGGMVQSGDSLNFSSYVGDEVEVTFSARGGGAVSPYLDYYSGIELLSMQNDRMLFRVTEPNVNIGLKFMPLYSEEEIPDVEEYIEPPNMEDDTEATELEEEVIE